LGTRELGDKDSNLDKRSQNALQGQTLTTIPQDSAGSQDGMLRDVSQSDAAPPRSAAVSEPTDAELERGILDALAKGLDGVAKALSARLNDRQRARAKASGLVSLAEERERRGR
jgi:hypothetical protein